MFQAKEIVDIVIDGIPVQWIPKIEVYYPDLPQFPIMYIHKYIGDNRLIAFPVTSSYDVNGDVCSATFRVLCNISNDTAKSVIKAEIEERIGLSDKITKDVAISCCNGNKDYENFISDLWSFSEKSYGKSIPYGQFYEEIYSIARFVAAWQPKTGRQSEMRMLYNFMSAFGEPVELPEEWSHLECYLIPNVNDVMSKNFNDFSEFQILNSAMEKTYNNQFSKEVVLRGEIFKVLSCAWKQNKDNFINNVSEPLYSAGVLNENERFMLERLVDAFNRHAWRAAFYISAYMNVEKDYSNWSKDFFTDFYSNGSKFKGYSEKVMACFLQQGFKNPEVIPIDTWIETFYQYSLGISTKEEFYDSFSHLGKLERLIWLASQANKTNMRTFFDLLWCQRYGTIGNEKLRGINPIACCECELKNTCVGLKNKSSNTILLCKENQYTLNDNVLTLNNDPNYSQAEYICALESSVPKKVFVKTYEKKAKIYKYVLIDEFSWIYFEQ